MRTPQPSWSLGRMIAGMVVLAGLGTGCILGQQDPTQLNRFLQALIDESGLPVSSDTVTVRIINLSDGLTEELDLQVDGFVETFECTAEEGVCNFLLAEVPAMVETLEERRFDEDENFAGGRVFVGQEEFVFTQDDYSAGSIIVFRLSETSAEAFVL